MGKTYKNKVRRAFALKKTANHKTRSKWSRTNQTRLRSLSVDVCDFLEHPESSQTSLHFPRSRSGFLKLEEAIKSGLPTTHSHVLPSTSSTAHPPSKTSKDSESAPEELEITLFRAIYGVLPLREIRVHLEFCQAQVRHIDNLFRGIIRRCDPSWARIVKQKHSFTNRIRALKIWKKEKGNERS